MGHYSSGCSSIFAEVSFWVRHGAPQVRSFRKIRVNLYRRTPLLRGTRTYVHRHPLLSLTETIVHTILTQNIRNVRANALSVYCRYISGQTSSTDEYGSHILFFIFFFNHHFYFPAYNP